MDARDHASVSEEEERPKRFASKGFLKLGMSCVCILHLLKRSFCRNLTLWVCSQTPKKETSRKPLKNSAEGRTLLHKKRNRSLFQSPRKVTYLKPLKSSIKGRTLYHKKVSNGLCLSSGEEKTPIMTSIKRCQKEKNDKIEEFAVVEAFEEKHAKDDQKTVPARSHDK